MKIIHFVIAATLGSIGSANAADQAVNSLESALPVGFIRPVLTSPTFLDFAQPAGMTYVNTELNVMSIASALDADTFLSIGNEMYLMPDSTDASPAPAWETAPAGSSYQMVSGGVVRARDQIDNLVLTVSPAVPEPETWAMLLAGLGLVVLQLRRSNTGRIAIN